MNFEKIKKKIGILNGKKKADGSGDIPGQINQMLTEALYSSGIHSFPSVDENVFPLVDIEEDASSYQLTVEVPGLSADDIEVTLKGNTLTLRGEKRRKRSSTNNGVHDECYSGWFHRDIMFDEQIDENVDTALLKDGILHLTLKKITGPISGKRHINIIH